MMKRLWAWLKRSFADAFEPALSGAWDGGAGTAARRRRATSGLGKPLNGRGHYIVRVFYGGDSCEESLDGPFATEGEANALALCERKMGHGAVVYFCTNTNLVG